jgi:hypothetical protein
MSTVRIYARLGLANRFSGRVFLGAIFILSLWSLLALYWPREAAPGAELEGGKDLQAYRAIVERVHHGESYYSAAAEELRSGGYSSSSVFNWRLPTYAWLLGSFPKPEWGQVLLCLLAVAALALANRADRQDGNLWRSFVLLLAMLGAFLWCIDGDAYFSQELWAGVLIAVSVGAFAVGLRAWGVAAGLAALMMRELALPYVLVSMVFAWREKHWREVGIWCSGFVVFVLFFCWHAVQVNRHLTGTEYVEADGWIQFGGPAFVISTAQMNVWLFRLPAWAALLYVIAAILGLAIWRGPVAVRISVTVGVYMLAFLVVGKPFNNYWGLLYVALLPWGLVRAPGTLPKLLSKSV